MAILGNSTTRNGQCFDHRSSSPKTGAVFCWWNPTHFLCWDFPVGDENFLGSPGLHSKMARCRCPPPSISCHLPIPKHLPSDVRLIKLKLTKVLPEFSYIFTYFHIFSSFSAFSWGDRCHLHAIGVHLFLQPSGVAILRSSGLTGERCHRLCPPGTGRHHRGGSEGRLRGLSRDPVGMWRPWMVSIWGIHHGSYFSFGWFSQIQDLWRGCSTIWRHVN